jgi:DNA-binding SARP family transcriptional activator
MIYYSREKLDSREKQDMDDDNDEKGPSYFPSFRIWLCGTFRVERRVGSSYEFIRTTEWGGSSYPRLLLKALLCSPGRQARRDVLLDMLWPDAELDQAVQNLNTAVTRLRRVLAPSKGEASLLLTDEDSHVYRLAEQSLLWVDVDAALTLLGEVERRGRTSFEALPPLEEAETYLSKGMILQDEEGQWAAGRRATVEQARYRTRLWLAEAYAQQQMPGQAETIFSLLLEEDPTDEDVLARLMLLLHRQGMTRQALRVYEQACEVFAREEVELTEGTRKLAAQLARSDRQIYPQELLPSPFSPTDEQNSPFSGIIETVNTSKGTMKQSGIQDMEPSRRYLFQLVPQVVGTAVTAPHVLFNAESWERLFRAFNKPSMVDGSVLDELEIMIGSYWRLFYSSPSPDLLDGIFGFLQTVTSLLERSHPKILYQRLCAIASKTTLLAGRIAFDQHHSTAVDRYYLLSHQTAQKTGDATLEAIVLARMASVLMEKQQLESAISLLQEARRLFTRGPYTATVHAWLATQEAETWAIMHQEVPCLKALEMAEHDTDTIISETDLYGTNFDHSLLSGFKGVCYLKLQKPEAAHQVLQDAISLALPSSSRQKAIFFSDLAATFVQRKEPEEACSLLGNALDLVARTKSPYVMQRLLGVRSELEEWSQQPYVKRLDEQLHATQRNVL